MRDRMSGVAPGRGWLTPFWIGKMQRERDPKPLGSRAEEGPWLPLFGVTVARGVLGFSPRLRGIRTPLLALALLLLLPPQQAAADAFNAGPPNGGYEADSANHLYCYGAGFDTGLRDDADYIMQSALDTETDMSDTFESSCNSGTDVEFLDANLPPGARGSYVCTTLSYVCWASEVTVDPAEINIGSNDTEDLRKTLCHEVGHSVGLLHGATDDCMLSGEIPNTNVQYRRYNYHHRWDHINVEY